MVELFEVAVKQSPCQRVVCLALQGGNAGVGAFAQIPQRWPLRRYKHHHAALAFQAPFAVAAACGLRNGVEPGQSAVDHGKVNVHARLHQLRADHAQWAVVAPLALVFQSLLDLLNDIFAVRAAHQGRQVQCAFGHQALQFACGLARVDNGQHAVFGTELRGNVGPGGVGVPVGRQFDVDAFQRIEQGIGVVDDVAHIFQPAQVFAGVEIRGAAQRRLGGSAQHHSHAVVLYQQVEHVQDGLQKSGWQLLRFVQYHDAAHQVVQLAAERGFGGKQRFKQLHVGGDHQRRVPVFAGQSAAHGFVLGCGVGLAVVFNQHLVAQGLKHAAKHVRRLLNDAGVGNGVNDAALAMHLCVLQRKCQTGQGFAAACGYSEREKSCRQCRFGTALAQHIGAQGVDRRVCHRQRGHVVVKRHAHLCQRREAHSAVWLTGIKVRFGVQKVCIHQAREQHAHPQRKAFRTARNAGYQIAMSQKVCRRMGVQRFFQLFFGILTLQAPFQRRSPIVQPRMVARNEISKDVAVGATRLVQLLHGPQRPGSRMGFLTPAHLAFDVRIGVVRLLQIALKTRPVFAHVMPQACQISPAQLGLGCVKGLRKPGCQRGNLVQMFGQQMPT